MKGSMTGEGGRGTEANCYQNISRYGNWEQNLKRLAQNATYGSHLPSPMIYYAGNLLKMKGAIRGALLEGALLAGALLEGSAI